MNNLNNLSLGNTSEYNSSLTIITQQRHEADFITNPGLFSSSSNSTSSSSASGTTKLSSVSSSSSLSSKTYNQINDSYPLRINQRNNNNENSNNKKNHVKSNSNLKYGSYRRFENSVHNNGSDK